MISKCKCLGCETIVRRQKTSTGSRCSPTELHKNSYDHTKIPERFFHCIPKLNKNINKCYERDANTSDLYRTKNIPDRFERSCTLNGYGSQYRSYHPVFRTTSSEYGWIPPNAHTVPHYFYPRSNDFSELLRETGMYRNYSLNTVMDKSRV